MTGKRRKMKLGESRHRTNRRLSSEHILSLNIFYLMLFLCLQGSRGADERVTLGHCKETGREHLMIAGSGSQLISDIRDKIITGCQSQDPGLSLVPGNIGPSAVCWHLHPALLDNLIWIYKTFAIGEWGIIHQTRKKSIQLPSAF